MQKLKYCYYLITLIKQILKLEANKGDFYIIYNPFYPFFIYHRIEEIHESGKGDFGWLVGSPIKGIVDH